MKHAIIIAFVASIINVSANAAEWNFDGKRFANKAECTKYARQKSNEEAENLFANPVNGFLALEKGKGRYLALPAEDPRATGFRCSSRNGEPLTFEGKPICVLTLKQYASKVLFKNYDFEKLGKDEGGFRRASGN